MSRLIFALSAALTVSACSIQHIKPKTLNEAALASSSIIFGSIAFPNEFYRFGVYTIEIRSLDTGEVHSFSLNEYHPDLETPHLVRGLFLRQVPPGRYEIIGIRTSSYPYSFTLTNKNPPKVTTEAGDSIYFGSHFIRFEWGKNVFGMPIPGGPSLLILNDLEIDYGIASKRYPSMPGLESITSAPWLTEDEDGFSSQHQLDPKTDPVSLPIQ